MNETHCNDMLQSYRGKNPWVTLAARKLFVAAGTRLDQLADKLRPVES